MVNSLANNVLGKLPGADIDLTVHDAAQYLCHKWENDVDYEKKWRKRGKLGYESPLREKNITELFLKHADTLAKSLSNFTHDEACILESYFVESAVKKLVKAIKKPEDQTNAVLWLKHLPDEQLRKAALKLINDTENTMYLMKEKAIDGGSEKIRQLESYLSKVENFIGGEKYKNTDTTYEKKGVLTTDYTIGSSLNWEALR